MKYSLIISAIILGISIVIASCKKAEEVEVEWLEVVEEEQSYVPRQEGLAGAMKKASIMMRRLARAVENDDWTKMDMWTHELKEGIGFHCVELYMVENNDIPNDFTMLSDKFNSAINKLILCSKEHDTDNAYLEFDNLVKSCDACHESFNKDMKGQLEFY
ncbi:MAG: cytochrome c [Candidatus Scalinduaceae bacterium]